MARPDLIRRGDALDALQIVAAWSDKTQRRALSQAYDKLHRVATVDAVPVVRCKDCWKRGKKMHCPMCYDEWFYDDDDGSDFVTHDYTEDYGFCYEGAKMDGGAEG